MINMRIISVKYLKICIVFSLLSFDLCIVSGDDLYPADPDYEGQHPVPTHPHTAEQSREQCQNLNRFEFHSPFDCRLICNVTCKFDVPSPKLD